MYNNNDSFAMIDDIIGLYEKGLLSVQETTEKAFQAVNQSTWFITYDINVKIKAENILYKRFFDKMHKAIIRNERR